MKHIQILYKGSQHEPYVIEVVKHHDGEIEIACNCQAATTGTHCKHRIAIITADYRNIIYTDKTQDDLIFIESWLPNTDLESAFNYMSECEKKVEEWKKELKNAKRKLARVMEGK